MSGDGLYIFSETIPNWIMALSAMAAVVVFWWRKQDKRELAAQREENILNGVNAVWVKADVGNSGQSKWGVVVSNEHRVPVTNVRVQCSGNKHSNELIHPNVQKGQHFFESLPQVERGRSWALPTTNFTSQEFITSSQKYETKTLSFTYMGKTYQKPITG